MSFTVRGGNSKSSNKSPYGFLKHSGMGVWGATVAGVVGVGFLGLTLAPNFAPEEAKALTENSEMAVGVNEVLSLRIVKQNASTGEWDVDTDVVSAEATHGSFASSMVKVIASTNGRGGYQLTMNDTDSNNKLVSAATLDEIDPLASSVTIDNITDTTGKFTAGEWGYSWAKNNGDNPSLTFNAMPTAETQMDNTGDLGVNTYNFTLGVRVEETTPATTYTDQVMFSLVGNVSPTAPAFYTTEYMQQFNSGVCNSVKTPLASTLEVTADNGGDYAYSGNYATKVPSTTIKDQRDNQTYTIRKLADGNCWMTSNLRLGKEGAVTLTSANSNLTSGRSFTLPAAKTVAGDSWENQAKYKFAFYRDSNPAAVNPTVKPEGVTPDSPSALYNWYTATAGARPASDPSISDPYAGDCSDNPDSATNCGALMTAASGQASDSVCPKGWQLPVNGSGTGTTRSYMNLVNIYTSAPGNSYADINSSAGQAAINTTNIIKLLDKPTSFVYSDRYYYGGTLFSRPIGYYWSSSVGSATSSYFLDFYTNGTTRSLAPQYAYDKGYAFAVRCVVAPAA